jgi:hypothetical protein
VLPSVPSNKQARLGQGALSPLQQIVIPSEVEGSRHESFKITQRDPSTSARDDPVLWPASPNQEQSYLPSGMLTSVPGGGVNSN